MSIVTDTLRAERNALREEVRELLRESRDIRRGRVPYVSETVRRAVRESIARKLQHLAELNETIHWLESLS